MTPPKLLHILGSSAFGGDSVLVLEMGRAAREAGFEVDVLATDPVFQDRIRQEGLGLIDLDVIRREVRPFWDTRGLLRLTRFLRDSSYAVVHTHTSKPGIVGRLAATRAAVPVIVHTVHGFAFHEETSRLPRLVYTAIERRASHWCDLIVTVSEHHRAVALHMGIGAPGKVVAIPNGVPVSRTEVSRPVETVRAELGIGDRLMVLSTGRLAEQKGLEYLIRAVPLLGTTADHVRVVMAGDGPLRDELGALITELGVEEVVVLLGFRSDIGDLLAAADVVALPSLWEGLSISLLEAMAAGKPIVTTSIASNAEVTGNGRAAVLVPPKDPAALADALVDLVAVPARRRELGDIARVEQANRFGMQPMLQAYLDQYSRLLREKCGVDPSGDALTVDTRHD